MSRHSNVDSKWIEIHNGLRINYLEVELASTSAIGSFIHYTVKLDFKELLNKEQIEFKELFTDYQLFYTINLQVNKELLPI